MYGDFFDIIFMFIPVISYLFVVFLYYTTILRDFYLVGRLLLSKFIVIYYSLIVLYIYIIGACSCNLQSSSSLVALCCYVILVLFSIFYMYVCNCIFYKNTQYILVIALSAILVMGVFFSPDFYIYFISIEAVSILLCFLFLYKNKNCLFTRSLFSVLILNFFSLSLFLISLLLLLYLYGTSDLLYIRTLYNGSVCESAVLLVVCFSVMSKLGRAPAYFYKISIYSGLSDSQLVAYSITYLVIVGFPSMYIIGLCFFILGVKISFIFLLFFILSILSIMASGYSQNDQLFISTLLFSLFLVICML